MSSTSHNHFEQEHARIGTGMQAHLLALVGADFAEALQHFDHWRQELMQHIAIENEQLLPHLPADARWPARMYELEHERITLLADEYRARLAQAAQQPPSDEQHAAKRCWICWTLPMPCATCWNITISAKKWRWRTSCRWPCSKPCGPRSRSLQQPVPQPAPPISQSQQSMCAHEA